VHRGEAAYVWRTARPKAQELGEQTLGLISRSGSHPFISRTVSHKPYRNPGTLV